MNYPKMCHIRQAFDVPKVDNIEETLSRELEAIQISSQIKPGSRIAITAGSRGVANIDRILRHLVRVLKENSAKPFLIPTMGSHGGGTAEGQVEVLKSLNVTEESVGAPIVSSMEVVEIGRSCFGFPVLVDKNAAEADEVIAGLLELDVLPDNIDDVRFFLDFFSENFHLLFNNSGCFD